MTRSKMIIAHFIAEKISMDNQDKLYVKGIITNIIDALKIKGIDYKLKKRLEDSYNFLSKALIVAGDKPANTWNSGKEN